MSTRAAIRQTAALCLGRIRYTACPSLTAIVCEKLLFQLDLSAKVSTAAELGLISEADVETRRYAIRSLADIVCQTGDEGTLLGKSARPTI